MSGQRDPTRIVRAWLEVGATALPDRVLDAVLDEVPMTRQRRRSLGQRLLGGHPARTFALAAAGIVVTLLGVSYLAAPNVVAPQPGHDIPTSTAPRSLPPEGPLTPGTYSTAIPIPLTFDVPAGLRACRSAPEPAVCGISIAELSFTTITNLVVDPCARPATLRDPPIGPSVDDLVIALHGLPGFDVHSVRDVIVDGHAGVELEITAPARSCLLSTWASPNRINGVSAEETNRLRIIEVDGTRLVLMLAYHPNTPPGEMAALQQTMDSVRFGTP
ncbi:MAG: hypothetical protein ABI622_05030 [Chloroflexota bacterium]